MKIRVIDFETTGYPEDAVRAICETGWTDFHPDGPSVFGPYSMLSNPGHPIPPQTRAVHHISDADVRNEPSPTLSLQALMSEMESDDIFAAHNAKFEKAFFGGGKHDWICTYKCAMRLWPEAPAHNNQTLRYWLGFDEHVPWFHSEQAMPPHRAGPDTYVTAFILMELLKSASASDLVAWSSQPVLLHKVTFGKHRGSLWKDLPSGYLHWIVDVSDMDEDAKHTARHYLENR